MSGERLLLDVMLGKLVTYLRMCGYDTMYAQEEGVEADNAIMDLADTKARRLVTRDRVLADRTEGAVLLESQDTDEQLQEFAAAGFSIELPEQPERCSICNGQVSTLGENDPRPEHAPDEIAPIWQCENCGQHFWKGSHWEHVTEIVGSAGRNP